MQALPGGGVQAPPGGMSVDTSWWCECGHLLVLRVQAPPGGVSAGFTSVNIFQFII